MPGLEMKSYRYNNALWKWYRPWHFPAGTLVRDGYWYTLNYWNREAYSEALDFDIAAGKFTLMNEALHKDKMKFPSDKYEGQPYYWKWWTIGDNNFRTRGWETQFHRFKGRINIPESGDWTFKLFAKDFARMWVAPTSVENIETLTKGRTADANGYNALETVCQPRVGEGKSR